MRANSEGDDKRDARDVSVQEAANAVACALSEQVRVPREDLVREAAKLLGFTRTGSNVTAIFDAAVDYAADLDRLSANAGGMLTLTDAGQAWYESISAAGTRGED